MGMDTDRGYAVRYLVIWLLTLGYVRMWVGESQGNQNAQVGYLRRCEFDMIPFKFSITGMPAPWHADPSFWEGPTPDQLSRQDVCRRTTVSWGRDERWDFNLTNGLYVRSSWFNRGSSFLNDILLYSSVSVLGKPMNVSVAELRGWRKL